MDVANAVLEYLKVFLSVQVVAVVGAVTVLLVFKADIRDFLRRTARIRFPGGGEVSTSQLEKVREELPARGEQPAVAAPNPPAPAGVGAGALEANLAAERARATLWEYRYLNYFLARGTQVVLDWLASLPVNTTVALFDTWWLPIIPSAQERGAIINALQAHYLIMLNDGVIQVTPKGREYLQWRGPLPPPAPAAA